MHAWDVLQSGDITEGRVYKICHKVKRCDIEELNIRYPGGGFKIISGEQCISIYMRIIVLKHYCIAVLKFARIWKGEFSEHV